MLVPSNFLFLFSLGLTSWIVLVYLKQIEQTYTNEVAIETTGAYGSDRGSSCGNPGVTGASRFLNFEFCLQFFLIFMCLFIMAKVAEYSEICFSKFIRDPENIATPQIGARSEIAGDQQLGHKFDELSCTNCNGEPMECVCSRMREKTLLTHLHLLEKQNMHLEQELKEILKIGHKFDTLMATVQTPPCTQTMPINELQMSLPSNAQIQEQDANEPCAAVMMPPFTEAPSQQQTLTTQPQVEQLNATTVDSVSLSSGGLIPEILRILCPMWDPKSKLPLTIAPKNQPCSSASIQGCKISQPAISPNTAIQTYGCEEIIQSAKSMTTALPTQDCEKICQPAIEPTTAKSTQGCAKFSQPSIEPTTAKPTQVCENISQVAAEPAKQDCEKIARLSKSPAIEIPTPVDPPSNKPTDMVSQASQTSSPEPISPLTNAARKLLVEGHTQTTRRISCSKCRDHQTSFLFHRQVAALSPGDTSIPSLWASYLDLQKAGVPTDYLSLLPDPMRRATKKDIETLESGGSLSRRGPMIISTEDLLKLKRTAA